MMTFLATCPIVYGITLYEKARRVYANILIARYLRDNDFVDIKTKNEYITLCKYIDGRKLIVVLTDAMGIFPTYVLSEHWSPRTNVLVVNVDLLNALDDTALYDFDEFVMERPILRCIGIEKATFSNMKIATCDGWYGLISRKFFIDEVRKERKTLDSRLCDRLQESDLPGNNDKSPLRTRDGRIKELFIEHDPMRTM
jgi:hypothetical protein